MLSKCLVVGSAAFVSLSFLTLSKCIEGSDKGDHIAHPLLYFWPSLSFAFCFTQISLRRRLSF